MVMGYNWMGNRIFFNIACALRVEAVTPSNDEDSHPVERTSDTVEP